MITNTLEFMYDYSARKRGRMTNEDMLYVAYDESEEDEPCICISKIKNGKLEITKVEYGKQAQLLYKALTEQSIKISEEKE